MRDFCATSRWRWGIAGCPSCGHCWNGSCNMRMRWSPNMLAGHWRAWRKLLKQFSLPCICFLGAAAFAFAGLPPDPLENPGFQHFYNLEYDEALAAFAAQSAKDPQAPEPYNYIAQTILFRQMFRTGAL